MNEQGNNSMATVSTILGIVSLVVSIIGGLTFGVIGAVIGLICGIVALVLAINVKKETDNQKGQTGFICGLLGVIFAAVFAVGCSICGAGSLGYGCYGCIGGSCFAASDINGSTEDLQDALDALQKLEGYN